MKQPHIILVTTDQQRFDTCGPAKPPFMRTPHFDRLANEGVLFSSGYSACPLCVPARIEMLTGRNTFAARGNQLHTQPVMDMNRPTLPQLLREQGYQTCFIGKYHVGQDRVRYGFDEIHQPDEYYRHMARLGYPQQPMRHGLGQNELYPGMATVPEAMTLTSWIAEQAVDFVRFRRDPSQPFFLWVSFSKPHPPLDPPEPYYSMYRNCDIPEPAIGNWAEPDACPLSFQNWRRMQGYDRLTPEVIREARAAYYGLITQCDYNLGRLLAALTDSAMLKDTLLMYTSDHGELLGDHHGGSKSFFFEGAAHVPFLLRPPTSWEGELRGRIEPTAVTHVDILPTLVRAAGGTPPEWADGMDLLALLRGEIPQPRQYVEGIGNETLYWFGRHAPCDFLALTDGRWKYIYYPEGPQEQLFDLQADPQELHDLSANPLHAERLIQLRAELTRRQIARGTTAVQDGKLISIARREITENQLRSRGWPGFHSESAIGDVRH